MPFAPFSRRGTPGIAPGQPGGDPGVSGLPQLPGETGGGGILEKILGQQQSYGGLLDPAMQEQFAKQQRNDYLLNLGAGLLAGSGSGQGFGAIAGQALQGAQAQKRQGMDDRIKNMLLVAQVKKAQREEAPQSRLGTFSPGDYTPESVAKFEQSGNAADLVRYVAPTNVKEGGQVGNFNPGDYTPQSFAKYLQTQNVADLVRYVAPSNPTVQLVNGVPTVVQPDRTGANAPNQSPLSTPEAEAEAKRRAAEADAAGAVAGKVDTERAATFQQDLAVIDDEILRTQKLLTQFQEGKYQTGPFAGMLPNIRTSAQNLSREQSKDVIKNISSATFGSLTEGERKFISGVGLDENKNEESNIDYLEEKISALTKAKQRLQSRPPVAPQGGAPAGNRPPLSSFRK